MNVLNNPPISPERQIAAVVRLRLPALSAAAISLGVYLLTIAPDISWANAATDGGELITASVTLGIPHPPGYPTYVLLGKLFSLLPLGTVAFRYNLLSAVCAAGAVGLLVATIGTYYRGRVSPPVAMAAALLFGFAPLVWSQAIVAEVYSLNLLLLAAFLLTWSRRGASVWAGFWLGLAITTHLTSLLMLPALLISGGRQAWRPLTGLAVGLSPLLLLPALAQGNSPAMWGRPTDPAGWWWLVSGRLYAANFQPMLDGTRLFDLLRAIALGPAALILADRTSRSITRSGPSVISVVDSRPSTILLAGTGVLYLTFALFYTTPDAPIYFLPGLMLLALLIAPLLEHMGTKSLILPLLLVIATFPARNLSQDREIRPVAESVLLAAPQDAILLTPGDRTIFTLWYFQHVEANRPDLILVDTNLFAFDWYRARLSIQYPNIVVPKGDNLAALQTENQTTRPFCLVGLMSRPELPPADGAAAVPSAGESPNIVCVEEAR